MRRIIIATAALALVYCADATGPDGPIDFAIIAGDGQVVEAGRDSLIEPVVGQAYRNPDGSVAFRLGPAPLHAQTTVGTGVPNVLTCAAPIGDAGLTPWLNCAFTDSEGYATYWFEPGTVAADSVCAEVRAVLDDQPDVVATPCATVLPGPVAEILLEGFGQFGPSPLTMRENLVQDEHGNAAVYDVVPYAYASRQGDSLQVERRTLVADSAGCAKMDAVAGDSVLARGVVTVEVDNTVRAYWASWGQIERGDTLPEDWEHGECWVNSP